MEIDVDQQIELAAQFAVRSMPTVVLWRDGREVGRFIGLRSRAFVAGVVARALAGDSAISAP
ncbi:Thioredoxin [compost metagenome]